MVGLDYPAVRSEARAIGLHLSHGLMRKIQALERFELSRKQKDEPRRKSDDTGNQKAQS